MSNYKFSQESHNYNPDTILAYRGYLSQKKAERYLTDIAFNPLRYIKNNKTEDDEAEKALLLTNTPKSPNESPTESSSK